MSDQHEPADLATLRQQLAALETYLQHKPTCVVNMEIHDHGFLAKHGLVMPTCTCGLDDARKGPR